MADRSPTVQRSFSLDELLKLVELDNFGLPDFQREFVWGAENVRRLLATVFMGWPAGLILLMEAPPENFFAVRPLEGLEQNPSARFRHLILDGQQRVTALAHAFGIGSAHNPREPRWFLDVNRFEEQYRSGDIEAAFVQVVGSPTREDQRRTLIPLSALRSDATFQRWRDRPSGELFDNPGVRPDRLEANRVWLESLRGVRTFQFPTTILPRSMSLAAVSMIFERLNTSGLRLDTFDLVVAHVYRDGHNLRAQWEQELYRRPVLRRFLSEDPLIAAELVAMVATGDTRRSALLELDPSLLWSSWDRAVRALEDSARFLTERAGIADASQLPHRGILLALAGAAYELDGLRPELDDLLQYWLFSRSLAERFNAATNTRVVQEYRSLVDAARGQRLPDVPALHRAIVNATRRANGSIWLAVLAIVRRQLPIDYPDGLLPAPVSSEWARPISLVRGSSKPFDPALGVVLGSPQTEAHLRGRSLREIRADLSGLDTRQVSEYLSGQLLPDLRSSAWDDASRFVEARAELVLSLLADLREQALQGTSSHGGVREIASHRVNTTSDLLSRWLRGLDEEGMDMSRLEVTLRLADDLLVQGQPTEAAAALQLYIESSGPIPPAERAVVGMLQGRALSESGLVEEAEAVLRRALTDSQRSDDTPTLLHLRTQTFVALGRLLLAQGRADESLPLVIGAMREHVARSERDTIPDSLDLALVYSQCLAAVGHRQEANAVARDLLDRLSSSRQIPDNDLVEAARRVVSETTP